MSLKSQAADWCVGHTPPVSMLTTPTSRSKGVRPTQTQNKTIWKEGRRNSNRRVLMFVEERGRVKYKLNVT